MKDNPIVIIPCGARKLGHSAQAQHMYIGSYHKMCQRYARSLTTPDNIYILSAKYGLLKMTDMIEPYSLTLGQPGCVTPGHVQQQAKTLEILDRPCIAVGGKKYTDLCRQIWRDCVTPLQGKGGNGKQMQWMKGPL